MENVTIHELWCQVLSGAFPQQRAKVNPIFKDGSSQALKTFKGSPGSIKTFLHNCSTSRIDLKNIYINTNISIIPMDKTYNAQYLIKNYQAGQEPMVRKWPVETNLEVCELVQTLKQWLNCIPYVQETKRKICMLNSNMGVFLKT